MKLKANTEFKFIISLMFAILVAIFAIQNAGNVEIRFFSWHFSVSQAVVILGSAIVGSIILLLLGLVNQIKQNLKMKQLSKELELLRSENNELQAKLDNLSLVNIEKDKVETEEKIPTELKTEELDEDLREK
jgi:uncharacterized integral membrane protein